MTTMLSERLLITRIITALGVALMLVIGVWSATHAEADRASESASTAVSASVAATDAAAPASDRAAAAADQVASVPDESRTLLDIVACLLGVFCGIVLLTLRRCFGMRAGAGSIRLRRSPMSRILPHARAYVPAPTLAQLALSRT